MSTILGNDSITTIKKWKRNHCAKNVLSEGGKLNKDEVWTVQLLEYLIHADESMTNVQLYYYKHVILSDRSDVIILCKSRESQGLPTAGDCVVKIMEGINGGKARFSCDENIFHQSLRTIDFNYLIWWHRRISFKESKAVKCELFRFMKKVDTGCSCYESLKMLLGLHSWREVFKVLVKHEVFGDVIEFDWENYEDLPFCLCLNPESIKILALHFQVPIMIWKDDDSFENYTVVDTAVAGATPNRILCLHVQGALFSPLEPYIDGFKRIFEIYSEERSIQIKNNVEIHKVYEVFIVLIDYKYNTIMLLTGRTGLVFVRRGDVFFP